MSLLWSCSTTASTMSFNSSSRMDGPRSALPPMSAPTSVEFDPETRAGYLDDINLFMAWMEGSFLYESGTLPDDSTQIQPDVGPVSQSPTSNEKPLTYLICY
jgi:hypothetical protein